MIFVSAFDRVAMLRRELIVFWFLAFRVFVLIQRSVTVSTLNQTSMTFKVYGTGKIPVAGMKLMAKVTTGSVFECGRLCWNNGNDAGCGGFLYQLPTCDEESNSPPLSQSGECQLLQFSHYKLLSYESTNSSCPAQLYVSASAATDCPYEFSKVGQRNKCYKLINQRKTMTDASTLCDTLAEGVNDSHLVYINDAVEQRDIAAYLQNLSASSPGGVCYMAGYQSSWIWNGACRVSHTGNSQFVWANNCSQQGLPQSAVSQSMNFTNWNPGEPNGWGAGGQFCVFMSINTDGSARWFDDSCNLASCSLCELGGPWA